jgi:alpha-galactosidase
MGVERFIIDDGWFKGRINDSTALGDWVVDRNKYPDGLTNLIQHVTELGMEFGIWVEPEMISKDSDLYRQHPDWLLQLDGYQQPTGRHQYVLDLQNPAVFNYLYQHLDDLLSHHAISYLKWDMNREVVQPGHQQQPASTQQVHALYRLIDQLKHQHPHIEIESCAAGGGRIDYEILKRTHRVWPSDNNDALERQRIQRGFSYFFPPEIMGSHIGATHCHATRRVSDIHFRGITALFGHMGIELDPVKESAAERAGFEHYISLHKRYRPLLHSGTNYRLSGDDPAAQVLLAVIAADRQSGLLSIAQLEMPTYAFSGTIKIPGLQPDQHYQLTLVAGPNNLHEIVNQQPAWLTEPLTLSGEWLATAGISCPILDPTSALLIEINRID